jgi:LytS/YehU family sensor histidine kinase
LVFSVLAAMLMKYRQTGSAFVPQTILVTATLFTMSISIGYVVIFMLKKATKLPHDRLTKMVVPSFIVFLISVVVIANISVSLGVFIWYIVKGMSLSEYIPNLFKYELSFANKSLYIWLMFFTIAFFFVLWNKSSKKEQALREEKLKFQYQVLKAQINPHFLFNSFNALSELMHDDVNKADKYIDDLSKMYRYIIDNEDKKLVPLKDELEFVNHYFNLQKVRNGEKVSLDIRIPDKSKYEVVPVSVQSLVENAIKHNSATVSNPLQIEIFIEEDSIVVKNNLQKKTTFEATTQRGLNNLKEQVKLILDQELDISEGHKEFVVKVPIQS